MEKETKTREQNDNEASHIFCWKSPLAKLQPYRPLLLKHHSRDSCSEGVCPCNFSYSLHFMPGAESGCMASADDILTGANKNTVFFFSFFSSFVIYSVIFIGLSFTTSWYFENVTFSVIEKEIDSVIKKNKNWSFIPLASSNEGCCLCKQ